MIPTPMAPKRAPADPKPKPVRPAKPETRSITFLAPRCNFDQTPLFVDKFIEIGLIETVRNSPQGPEPDQIVQVNSVAVTPCPTCSVWHRVFLAESRTETHLTALPFEVSDHEEGRRLHSSAGVTDEEVLKMDGLFKGDALTKQVKLWAESRSSSK